MVYKKIDYTLNDGDFNLMKKRFSDGSKFDLDNIVINIDNYKFDIIFSSGIDFTNENSSNYDVYINILITNIDSGLTMTRDSYANNIKKLKYLCFTTNDCVYILNMLNIEFDKEDWSNIYIENALNKDKSLLTFMKTTSKKEKELNINKTYAVLTISNFLDKKYLKIFCLNIFDNLFLFIDKQSATLIASKLSYYGYDKEYFNNYKHFIPPFNEVEVTKILCGFVIYSIEDLLLDNKNTHSYNIVVKNQTLRNLKKYLKIDE